MEPNPYEAPQAESGERQEATDFDGWSAVVTVIVLVAMVGLVAVAVIAGSGVFQTVSPLP